MAWIILTIALVAPLGEPFSVWDHWPSWAVYAARPEQIVEQRSRVQRAMAAVGLPFAEFKDRVTFSLSGGQMRRVALAGKRR